eukprot:TRINITY_DN7424_c0_g1_i6.p2 TRINITY_DN7424_c0_g1~~TRINITY_DN7424_c0_g1_i6.p2  ORF type:complete len:113 (-),score=1.58 TRINITY_DN7424_c0_g1_i6:166-504(-)
MINSVLEFAGSEKEKQKGLQLGIFLDRIIFSSFFHFLFLWTFQCVSFVDFQHPLISCFVWKIVRVKGANISRQIFLLVIQIEIGNYFRVFMSVSNSLVRFIMNVFQCANIVN